MTSRVGEKTSQFQATRDLASKVIPPSVMNTVLFCRHALRAVFYPTVARSRVRSGAHACCGFLSAGYGGQRFTTDVCPEQTECCVDSVDIVIGLDWIGCFCAVMCELHSSPHSDEADEDSVVTDASNGLEDPFSLIFGGEYASVFQMPEFILSQIVERHGLVWNCPVLKMCRRTAAHILLSCESNGMGTDCVAFRESSIRGRVSASVQEDLVRHILVSSESELETSAIRFLCDSARIMGLESLPMCF